MSDAQVAQSSRYILTETHTDDFVSPGRLRFGLWKPPDIDMTDYDRHTVVESELGRLDLIAYKTLGNSAYWWAIALVNSIANPLSDLVVGQLLKIPKLDAVTAAMSEG